MGIGVVEKNETALAACATVEVSRAGELRVVKMTIVANSGYIINPRAAEEQIKGCVAWELSHLLYGGLHIEGGRVQNTNFDTYKLLRLPEMPEVEVIFTMSEDGWWGGLGEVAVPATPPAVCNAIYFATGKRLRTTPIEDVDLTWS
jgi:isoquinoline 1-oxidoreductase beta subunit